MKARHAPGNPFYFGDLALDEAFTDREAELRTLERDMVNGRNVALIAPRRYGKSSLVRRASQELAAREGVLVAEVDLMKTPTKERFASHLARAVHDELASSAERAKEGVLSFFASLRVTPVVTVNPVDGSFSFSFSATHSPEDIDATIERLLELPAELAAERKRRVVVYFDEFQEVVDIDPRLPALMRAVFQEQPDVAHVFAGSKREMMRRLFNDENEPFYRSAKVMEIGRIPVDVFAVFLRERFDSTDRGLSEEALERLLAATGGHPYGTQELAYALWDEVPLGYTASPADLDRALDAVLRSENARFTLLWENLARSQRQLLQALAVEPGRVQSAGYIARHALPSASTTQKAAEALVRQELIARRPDGAHEIAEPFLAEWVTRYAA
jgi:AAA+ ATPase superfamily predicted ATPase